ncbi:MAG: DNA polymerase II large subunit [Candidatus Nanoarchaeia archaeon]
MSEENIKKYFENINLGIQEAYKKANLARAKGYDPDLEVSIPLTKDMSERVIGLVSVVAPQIINSGIIERIKELEKEYGLQDWRVAFRAAEEVAQEKFCKFKNKIEAIEVGLRLGLAYLTNGVVSSPLEGFVKLEAKKRKDGKEYLCLYFSGPIRSAGTTASCAFIGLADYVRLKLGYDVYDPTQEEIKRASSEIHYFHDRITNLQYLPSEQEIEFLTKNLPIQIDGDPSEEIEVPNYKDLERIKANKLRSGYCLVMAEGLSQKLAKFWGKFSKWNKEFGMEHWIFAEQFVDLQKKIKAGKAVISKDGSLVKPDFTYIKDLVAGRPILGYPLRTGTFRLRYGRSRVSGFSSDAICPSTMAVLKNYIAIGTQLRTERPGKSTTLASCDSIEGPIVKLKDGSVIFIENEEHARQVLSEIEEIIFLGDILVNYGDFLDRSHMLLPAGYCEEWWALELEKELKEKDKEKYTKLLSNPIKEKISAQEAINISRDYKIPLHPRYTYHWKDIKVEQLLSLLDWLKTAVIKKDRIIFPLQYDIKKDISGIDPKRVLEVLGVPHKVSAKEYVVIENDWADAFKISLGFYTKDFDYDTIHKKIEKSKELDNLEIINKLSEVKIRDKSGYFIGSRMGRPEKSKMRKMTGSPHTLFPVGEEGGRLRCFQAALELGRITGDFPNYYCDKCQKETIYPNCEVCNNKTREIWECTLCGKLDKQCMKKDQEGNPHKCFMYKTKPIDIKHYFDNALEKLKLAEAPQLIKGVRGALNEQRIPEHLIKGILRALHNIYVNKDGTTRYDMTEATITHFKPKEIGTSIEKLKELGYEKDVYGKDLENEEQILELKCQDVILPSSPESLEEGADMILYRVANFLDDLLVKLYGEEKFYNLKSKKDLVGHLVISLSPHTAAGIVARIIGFSKTQGFYAHPLLHSAMRRDCDGDEAGVMLIMDALLNFSRKLLSSKRGATQDEPIILSSIIVPAEVDDMVFNMDTAFKYPLEFYEAATNYTKPADFKLIETFRSRLNKPEQYEGLGFTHDTSDINAGVHCSVYKTIPSMEEKVFGQMELAEKIRAVDEVDVAKLIIDRHFIRDIKGNLRKFSQQEFRCVNCNEKFRRPPLKGTCTKCNGKIIFTISEGSITKYLGPSMSLAEKYELPPYLIQDLELTKQRIESMFGKEKEKQEGLGRWFG